MWAHRPWIGRHLPAGSSGSELDNYARLLTAVEGNTTFYALPSPPTVARWVAQTADGFEFVFKMPRVITHDRRLRGVGALVREAVERLAPLGERIGGFTFQLPASFGPDELGALDAVLADAPRPWRWSVEVRHPGLFVGPGHRGLTAILEHHGAERVLLDSRPLFSQPPRTAAGREAREKKPRVPALTEPLTDRPIVRFIGSDDPGRTEEGLEEWVPIVAGWLHAGRTPTFFVHTPDNVDSPALARRFHALVGLLIADLEPLPEPLDPTDPVQERLF